MPGKTRRARYAGPGPAASGNEPPPPRTPGWAHMLDVVASPSGRYTGPAQAAIGNVRPTAEQRGDWPPTLGWMQPPDAINLDVARGANYNVLQHELGHYFDQRQGVTAWGAGGDVGRFGQIANPQAFQDWARREGVRVPTVAEIKEYPYSAAYRGFMPVYPNETGDLTEQYAFAAQTPETIPPALRMFYPQFTGAAFQGLRPAERTRWVQYEDGTWGRAPTGEALPTVRGRR